MTSYIDVSDNMPESYRIVFGGDTHCFAQGFAWSHAERTVQHIRNHGKYWTCHGDLIDCMLPQDKRFRFSNPASSTEHDLGKYERAYDQVQGFLDFFDPIADKCIEVGIGNHEDRIMNVLPVAEMVSKAWNNAWGAPITIIDLGVFKAFLWHPFRFTMNLSAGDPQQRYTNECMRIRRAMRYKPGAQDCLVNVMSHIHKIRISKPMCTSQLYLGSDRGEFESFKPDTNVMTDPRTGREYYHEDYRWFASTGAMYGYYVDGDYTYAETRHYDPTDLGWVEAEVLNGKFVGLRELDINSN